MTSDQEVADLRRRVGLAERLRDESAARQQQWMNRAGRFERDLLAAKQRVGDLEVELGHLKLVAAGGWQCDGCNQWFPAETERVGHECDLCPECARREAETEEGE